MKTVREETFGKATVRLVEMKEGFAGLVIRPGSSNPPHYGTDPETLWRELVADLAATSTGFFGYDGAVKRFLKSFPGGFSSEAYLGYERNYKLEASRQLCATVTIEAALDADQDACRNLHRVASKTNLLSRFEMIRLKEVFDGPEGPAYARGAAQFAQGDIAGGLAAMEKALVPYGTPSWPLATYFPFLWKPAEHMYLKPMVMKDFAERVGDAFAYDYTSALKPFVYESLQRMTARLAAETVSLNPKDNIDLQSFIWVAGAYLDEPDAGEAVQAPS